jgi:hypothetical protein
MAIVEIETFGGLQPIVSRYSENGAPHDLQVIGLSGGETITIEESIDGINWKVATTDGTAAFVIDADTIEHILPSSVLGSGYIRAIYSGASVPDGLRVIWR